MRAFLFLIILHVLFPLAEVGAQVYVDYDDFLTGRMSVEEVASVQVRNFVGVTIDYLYRGLILDENERELVRLESGVITQEQGVRNLTFGDLPELQVVWQRVDIEAYTGLVTFRSMLVHPLDTTSIIAMEDRSLQLQDGVVVDENGKPLGDPREVDFLLMLHEGPFDLERLYEEAIFRNDNEVEICLPLHYQILQGNRPLYEARLPSLCLPPGNSKLPELPGAVPEVITDVFADRSPDEPIHLMYKIGDRLSGNQSISPVSHFPRPIEYERYVHQPTGLSFLFPAQAMQPFYPEPENSLVIFNAANEVESVEVLQFPSNSSGPFGMQDPFRLVLRREGFNGGVNISVLKKDNFSDAQWRGFLAHVNGVAPAEMQLVRGTDWQMWVPPKLFNERKQTGAPVGYATFAFGILENDRVVVMELFVRKAYVPLPGEQPPVQDTLDFTQMLNSLTYHGAPVAFQFEGSEIREVAYTPSATADDRQAVFNHYREYRWLIAQRSLAASLRDVYNGQQLDFDKLEEVRQAQDELEKAAFPAYLVMTHQSGPALDYRPFEWDSMNMAVTYRQGEKEPDISTPTFFEGYTYNQAESVVSWTISSSKRPDSDTLLRVWPTSLLLRPHPAQTINLSRWAKTTESDSLLRLITIFHNGLRYSPEGEILVEHHGDWTIYAPPFLRNGMKQTNCVLVDSGKYIYRLQITGGFRPDIVRFLEEMRIEGKKLHIEYAEDRLEDIRLTD